MELTNLLLIFAAGWLVWKRPDKEALAFGLLLTSAVLTVFLFFRATRTSILPPFNY